MSIIWNCIMTHYDPLFWPISNNSMFLLNGSNRSYFKGFSIVDLNINKCKSNLYLKKWWWKAERKSQKIEFVAGCFSEKMGILEILRWWKICTFMEINSTIVPNLMCTTREGAMSGLYEICKWNSQEGKNRGSANEVVGEIGVFTRVKLWSTLAISPFIKKTAVPIWSKGMLPLAEQWQLPQLLAWQLLKFEVTVLASTVGSNHFRTG